MIRLSFIRRGEQVQAFVRHEILQEPRPGPVGRAADDARVACAHEKFPLTVFVAVSADGIEQSFLRPVWKIPVPSPAQPFLG